MNDKQQAIIIENLFTNTNWWSRGIHLLPRDNKILAIPMDEFKEPEPEKKRPLYFDIDLEPDGIPIQDIKEGDLPENYNPFSSLDSGNNPFMGHIEDVRFWNRSINNHDIAELHKQVYCPSVSAGMIDPLYDIKPTSIWQMIKDFWKCEGWQ